MPHGTDPIQQFLRHYYMIDNGNDWQSEMIDNGGMKEKGEWQIIYK